MDVNEELKFFCENSKNIFFLGGGGRRGDGGRCRVGGVRVDRNKELKFL